MIADIWADQFAPASLTTATRGLVPFFPRILDRAGRQRAAIAWANAPSDLRTRAIALAQLARQTDSSELRTAAWATAGQAHRGTYLDVMTILGWDPVRDAGVDYLGQSEDADLVGQATALWANPHDKAIRAFAMEHHGRSVLLDAAAIHAGLAEQIPTLHLDPLDVRIVAAAVENPLGLLALLQRDSSLEPSLIVLERLVTLGGQFPAQRLAGASATGAAVLAWLTEDREACQRVDREVAEQRAAEGFDEIPLLVDAVYASAQPDAVERLDELAHGHLVTVLGADQPGFLDFIAGAIPIYPGVSAREVERAERELAREEISSRNLASVLGAAAMLASHGEVASARSHLGIAERVKLTTILRDPATLSLAVTTWARLGDLEKITNLTDAILPIVDGRALAAYASAVAKTNRARASVILERGIATSRRRLSRRDLVELVPGIVAVEPDAAATLHHGWRMAEDALATLHAI